MDQPKWEIHFEPHKPNRVRVVGDKGVIEGRVAEGYPYTITWGNEEGQGNAMLVQVPSDDPEPVHEHVILAEYQPREGQAERFSLFHLRNKHVHTKEKFWTGKRFAGWLEDVKKHRLEPIDASDWGSVSARAEDTEEAHNIDKHIESSVWTSAENRQKPKDKVMYILMMHWNTYYKLTELGARSWHARVVRVVLLHRTGTIATHRSRRHCQVNNGRRAAVIAKDNFSCYLGNTMKLSITLISVLPGLNFAAPLDEESHYCFDNGDVLRCLSLDRFGVAFLTEDTLADNAKLNCKSWGPLTPSHGTYHGLGVEPFTLKSIRGHVEMQIAGELSPVLLRAVHPESPKSLNGLASVFVVDEPKCEIELSAFNPDRVWVNWTEEVTEGVVTPDYPFIATWSNKGEDGTALLFKLDAEPFVLAKHKATGRDAKRCLLTHR
ncbi:hypothetical protein FOL47_010005 [Perkinsus chesapeaki]|uniref:Uncharacterized protein n=1 Tax=Perkinsus chesapeaki TaxID=330153 RepID=A0A7J6MR95_PERCH|nr:hypothetical protein FOL47_010005 [Perkinsus chesapeaki]